jgi:hypothetical protein
MLGAIPFSPHQDFGLELVDSIAIAQYERDGAVSWTGRKTDAQLPGRREYGRSHRRFDPIVSIRDAQDHR